MGYVALQPHEPPASEEMNNEVFARLEHTTPAQPLHLMGFYGKVRWISVQIRPKKTATTNA